MPHVAITSYIPPEPHIWPTSGQVEWSQISKHFPAESDTKFLSLPCQHPEYLLWQGHWVVLEIADADYEVNDGYVAFQRGSVLFNGPAKEALVFLRQNNFPAPHSLEPFQVGLDFENVALGKYGIAIAGWDASAKVGNYGLAFASNQLSHAGEYGIAVSKFGSVVAGDLGCAWTTYGQHAKAGHRGVARTDEGGRSEVAGVGVATTDDWGTAICGQLGVALAGMCGTAIAGERGVAYARQDGKVMAGEGGVLLLVHHDEIKVAKVGENGIKANTAYQLDDDGNFVECEMTPDEQYALDSIEIP